MDWREIFRNLLVERMVWIRQLIISLMFNLKDLSFVASRTLRNGAEIGSFHSHLYGIESGNAVESLLTQQVLLLAEAASTLRAGGDASSLKVRLEQTGDQLAESLSSVNPYVDAAALRKALRHQFELEWNLMQDLYKGNYEAGVANFDESYSNALQIVNLITQGIAAQFQI